MKNSEQVTVTQRLDRLDPKKGSGIRVMVNSHKISLPDAVQQTLENEVEMVYPLSEGELKRRLEDDQRWLEATLWGCCEAVRELDQRQQPLGNIHEALPEVQIQAMSHVPARAVTRDSIHATTLDKAIAGLLEGVYLCCYRYGDKHRQEDVMIEKILFGGDDGEREAQGQCR